MSDTVKLYSADDIRREQRTEQGLAYEKLVKGAYRLRNSHDPEHKSLYKRLNDEFMALKGVSSGSVHSNTFLSNMSVQYKNDDYIGESLVGLVPVGKRSDAFATYPKRERLAFPDDELGSRSHANELSETRSSSNYSVLDYGYQNFVSQETLDNQDAVFDEMMDLVDSINEGMAFRRELRIASKLTTAANYDSANTATLSGSDQWDSAAGGNPVKDIQTMKSLVWEGRGASDLMGFCSLSVFNVLSRHPMVLDMLKYQRSGMARRSEIAEMFGLTDLLVGAARKDTANIGQTASYSRIWGLDFGIVRVARRATKRSAHFASVFRVNGDPVTTEWFDAAVGKSGGHYAKVGVSEDLKVVANDAGALYKSVVSA
jgi:hypothetical protein